MMLGRLAACVAVGLAAAATARAAAMPPFSARVSPVTAQQLRWSYHRGCPVAPAALRRVRLRYRGFDGRAHLGTLVVNRAVVRQVVAVFRRLYREGFPIRRMRPVDAYRGSDDRSAAADNTSAFNCRYAVTTGPRQWSAHAYGEAVDVNPLENPYLEGARVVPPAGRRYADRAVERPGMAVAGGALVSAFASVGWLWGGRWTATPDYQHFSATGG